MKKQQVKKTEAWKSLSPDNSFRARKPRRILCVRFPHLYLQLAEQSTKTEKGASIIVASGEEAESTVVDFSKDLAGAGIKKGMFLKDIYLPGIEPYIFPAPYALAEKIRLDILKLLSEFSPEVKSPSPEEFYINLTGTQKLMGREIDTATRIAFRILCSLKLVANCGIGSTPQLARMASTIAGQGGVYEVLPEAEDIFLARLSPLLIPGISRSTRKKLLAEYNISSISELRQMNTEELLTLFGKEGLVLHIHSRGGGKIYSNRYIESRHSEKRHFRDTRTIPVATTNPSVIYSVLHELLSALWARSRSEALFPGKLSLGFIYTDNYTKTLNRKLRICSTSARDTYLKLKQMAEKLLTRRVKVKKIELVFSELSPAPQQLLLFDEENNKLKLNKTLDQFSGLVSTPFLKHKNHVAEHVRENDKTSTSQARGKISKTSQQNSSNVKSG